MKKSTVLKLLLDISLCRSAYSFSLLSSDRPVSALFRPSFTLKGTADDDGIDISFGRLESPKIELTETEIELIARNLKETIDFPFLPNALEKQIVKAALTSFCQVAPVALPKGLFLELVSGNEEWDNIREEVIHELNDAICIPIVSRQVQDQIVDSICTVMFTSKSEKSAKRQMLGRVLQSTLNQESEEEFATMLNDMIDVPFMSEEQEQKMMRKLAWSIHNAFESLVPEAMREILMGSSPDELKEARQNLIDRINEKIDIPFKSDEEERKYFEIIVDFLLKRYGLEKGTKLPEEEIVDIEKELDVLEVELEVQEAIYEKKIKELAMKKKCLLTKRAEVQKLVKIV